MDIPNRPTWQWTGETAEVPSVPSSANSASTGSTTDGTTDSVPRPRTAWKQTDEEPPTPTPTASTPGTFATAAEDWEFVESENANQVPPKPQRHYNSRKCRICLEVVHPTIHPPAEGIAGMLNPAPVVEYISEDPSSGLLIRPCNCKGSMRWIHEGCLREWRAQDPGSSNYWQCPTCKFEYRLQRMEWRHIISNKVTQISLTILILLVSIFILGFVADPIINLYLDPYEVLMVGGLTEPVIEETGSWAEHLLKGFASLGVLGLIKAVIAMGPWQWLHIRNTGVFGGGARRGRAATGRDRMAQISWWLVAFGVLTFLWAVYKLVSAWSRRLLDLAGERVADVQGPDDGDDDAAEDE